MIAIVDYGMANLRSVQKAFEAVGHAAVITSDPAVVAGAAKVVLPGVGAFRDAAARLHEAGFAGVIRDHIAADKPFLGICLGLQLLFDRSLEDGEHRGLGIFAGDVVRFAPRPGLKVPHMGWNMLRFTGSDCRLFHDLPADPAVYFVHGYYAVPADPTLTVAVADYPDGFCAAIQRGNTYAVQFHPEKSQDVGLTMVRNFAQIG